MKFRKTAQALKALFQARVYKKKTPLIVSWALTARCNLRCKHCNAWNLEAEELETGQILRLVEELSRMGTCKIQFTGGESLLRDDIGQILDCCKIGRLGRERVSEGPSESRLVCLWHRVVLP